MRLSADVLNEATQAHIGGRSSEAEALYDHLIAADPEGWYPYYALGTLYGQEFMAGRAPSLGRAMVMLHAALALKPDSPEALSNLASCYGHAGRRERALELFTLALETPGGNKAETWSNLAGIFVNNGTPELAIKYAERALAINPELAEARNHKALGLLELSQFADAWPVNEGRQGLAQWTPRVWNAEVPQWRGERCRRLAIWREQGLGDEIMFLTCLEQIRDRAEEISIECAPRLVEAIQYSFPWAKVYGVHTDRPWEPDYHCPMGSLPLAGAWPVKPNTYLKTPAKYPKGARYRIGISWFGGTSRTQEALRNTLPCEWRTLLGQDAEVISVQYGERDDEAAVVGVDHDQASIDDVSRLLAMIQSCDLVVSVINTTVHMAGAMGVPCLALVPAKPSWPFGLKGEHMVWYESVRLIRQAPDETWASVLERARERCADYR